MRSLSDTLTRLAEARRAGASAGVRGSSRLTALGAFGSNPGQLKGWTYTPADLGLHRPLVVVLHGCTQTAAGYDVGAGWSALADRYGFALLFPEQQRSNNANLCFNWFEPGDVARGAGEALSISQMVEAVCANQGIDRRRVFITGLSAGGAMAAALLATYPEIFAGGAIIAGLPFGSASSVPEAFDRMRGHGSPTAGELVDLMRRASPHTGPWPTLSIWHGAEDRVVDSANGATLFAQWRALHGLQDAPVITEAVGRHQRRSSKDAKGRDVVEYYTIEGMGHGTPLETQGEDGLGTGGPYMLEAGLSSTLRIAQFWGIVPASQRRPMSDNLTLDLSQPAKKAPPAAADGQNVGTVIETALRSAGLMK